MSRWGYFTFFPRSIPRPAKGGIKAQSKRGAFGESWWAKRWIAVLESFNIGARLDRGRSYARRGQVLSIRIEKGTIKATVQGSRPTPYKVTVQIKTLSGKAWSALAKALSRQAIFAAKLLAGEMPREIEKAFEDLRLSLFPERSRDLVTECSCPDWSNPCKHTAAVFYLLGQEFDRDPFLIFKMRGMSREEFVGLLGGASKEPPTRKSQEKTPADRTGQDVPLPPEPLTSDPSRFWAPGSIPEDLCGEVQIPPVPAALPKRLGAFPFWRGEVQFLNSVEPSYTSASKRGMGLLIGERSAEPSK
jgi:uncharacterized Zn finger protein